RTQGGQFDRTIELRDDVTRIHGKHELKAGADLRSGRAYQKPLDETGVQGQFQFSQIQTALPTALTTTGHSFATSMLRLPNAGAWSVVSQTPDVRSNYAALYVQDTFRFNRKLTLNVGLRYDLPFPVYDNNDFMTSFDPNLANPAAGGLKGAISFAGKSTGR